MTIKALAPAGDVVLGAADEAALDERFARLYEEAFPRVYAFVYAQVGDPHLASEVAGRVFLRAYQARTRVPGGGEAMFWLFRIARTVVIDFWRVDGRRMRLSTPLADSRARGGTEPVATGKSPEAILLERERIAMLAKAMESLAERDRTLLALKFGAKHTNRDMAGILSISEAAVSMRLMRALRRLRQELDARGLAL